MLVSAVRAHFKGTLAHLDQPDTMSAQFQYLRRTHAGPGTISIEDLKLGGGISTVQVVLWQEDRREVQGFIVQANFAKQTGVSVPTTFLKSCMLPTPPPIDFTAVEKSGEDANWIVEREPPGNSFRRAIANVVFHHPKHQEDPSYVDQWIRFRPGGASKGIVPFPQEALGFVVDVFPHMVEKFPQAEKGMTRWYPTVALNLDVKRQLPPGGANWLFMRVRAAEIRNGRLDLQVLVLDEEGNIVALSSHVSLVMSSDRNMAERRPGNGAGTNGKL